MTKAKLPKLNVRLLRKIERHLSEEPARYNQNSWGRNPALDEPRPECGTVGCIGGWAVFLSTPQGRWRYWKKYFDRIEDRARKLLGLTSDESTVLFSPSNQRFDRGPEGVEAAKAKIAALIADRSEFAKGGRKW